MNKHLELPSDSIVDRVYEQLKAMAVSYEFKPGERLNEGELAKRLGVSRTPLREALNRLNTEGFLRFTPGKGFFCRELDAHEIFDLYELRKSIEVASIRLAIKRQGRAHRRAVEIPRGHRPRSRRALIGRAGRAGRDVSRTADGDV
ncbi:GntR family transcriptional regulator [Bradyrhizobium sp. LLZ17]|uniref:GntR family transcriptional regulator n=1 Tax=Bradyrhizobium sp. LLZ17 TaxID=3239388 RepID=A0AB39XGH2_9BRAD